MDKLYRVTVFSNDNSRTLNVFGVSREEAEDRAIRVYNSLYETFDEDFGHTFVTYVGAGQ